MADYELIGLNEAAPDLRAPTAADRGILVGGVRVVGLAELDGGADINGSRITTVTDTNPLRQAVRVAMTAAASGSNGIQVLDNANVNMGTNNFTLHWEGALPDYTPSADTRFLFKISSNVGYIFALLTTGLLRVTLNATSYVSTVATGVTDGQFVKFSAVITRETASVAGSIVFYVNGVQLGSAVAIASGSPATTTQAINLYIKGTETIRHASDTTNAIIYNRALSAAEVLSLCVNGPALADVGASQTNTIVSTCVNGGGANDYTTFSGASASGYTATSNGSGDHFAGTADELVIVNGFRYQLTGNLVINSGVVGSIAVRGAFTAGTTYAATVTPSAGKFTLDFVASANDTVRFYTRNQNQAGDFVVSDLSFRRVGVTGQWNAQDAQSNTGQIFDSSGNKNHAMLPAAGATIIGKEMSVPKQVRWTNTWAGTNELQYIGGVNQAILPAKAYIESIVGVVTGATVEDIIIGDGSDTDRYVTITTGLAAGTTTFTLANRTTDGTNLKLTVDPDTNATMSIAWTITYRTLE